MTKAESTKAHATPEFVAGLEGMSEAARQSLATMSGAFSTWLQDASRMQGEAVRFLGERFHKDMELIGRLSQCKRPEDVLSLQTQLVGELIADYMNESKTMFSLLGEASKHGLDLVKKSAPRPTAGA
ncbi:MAG: hypothetical protein GXC76_00975 [Rhodanobacteraceae bacterium]|jgi:hypothetical protein|nr:hypothetical protein [Rhodanobacteraceae bacterium]